MEGLERQQADQHRQWTRKQNHPQRQAEGGHFIGEQFFTQPYAICAGNGQQPVADLSQIGFDRQQQRRALLIGRTPSRRWGDVEDLVGAAVFLSSDASKFVNGHILYVDGGVTATL